MTVMKKLLVVESPTKARTIGKYLGKDYEVIATVGHLRDLPKKELAVDVENNFEPKYVVSTDKKDVVSKLLKSALSAKEVILATDPDREGEAISWHVWYLMTNGKNKIDEDKIKRVTFHEITKEAVETAMSEARAIDMDLVDAQQGRRVLDRLVGYKLSPVLWKKVRRGLSAGRVQSVAVRLIAEREKEIKAFVSENFYKVAVEAKASSDKFEAGLVRIEGENFEISRRIKLFDGNYSYTSTKFVNEGQVKEFETGLDKEYEVKSVESKEAKRHPLPPLTTSKMQQTAARRFGWSGKQTMRLAQRLYEKGLITYHRTDSFYLAPKAVGEIREYLKDSLGAEYLSPEPRVFKNHSKNAQEAHEAIRPTDPKLRELIGETDTKEEKLYALIWKRAVATQATDARVNQMKVVLTNNKAEFEATGVSVVFDGFLRVTGEKTEEVHLPHLNKGDKLGGKLKVEETKTSPPPRYNDASLVSSLEKQGIGRPSTYAPIISTIQDRQYVERDEGKFKPTSLGTATNEFLVKNFDEIMSLPFTATMEEGLDQVARGEAKWQSKVESFWKKFEPDIARAEKEAERVKVEAESLGQKCPKCVEGDLVLRVGRFGKFISCGRFPDCDYKATYKEDAGFNCPTCGNPGVVKKTKTGRKFYGCSNYPNCKWASWKKI
jgi:DNA topoisomerase-1